MLNDFFNLFDAVLFSLSGLNAIAVSEVLCWRERGRGEGMKDQVQCQFGNRAPHPSPTNFPHWTPILNPQHASLLLLLLPPSVTCPTTSSDNHQTKSTGRPTLPPRLPLPPSGTLGDLRGGGVFSTLCDSFFLWSLSCDTNPLVLL